MLTRDQILAAQDITTEEVIVPQWGGIVLVRGMSGTERDAFEASVVVEQPVKSNNRAQRRAKRGQTEFKVNRENLRAKVCAWCIVDENGDRLFSDGDVEAIGAKSGAAIDTVYNLAARLSGISDDDIDDLAEEMLEERPFADSSSP